MLNTRTDKVKAFFFSTSYYVVKEMAAVSFKWRPQGIVQENVQPLLKTISANSIQ